jgi:hypothetical protein
MDKNEEIICVLVTEIIFQCKRKKEEQTNKNGRTWLKKCREMKRVKIISNPFMYIFVQG